MKKVKINVSFEFECEVDAKDNNEAYLIASDNAMDYLDSMLQDSRKLDEFWEYEARIQNISVADV
ncbi:MAG: hypothetical protein COA99_19565 [Moraxellaceae bacterium]|nr:MAG: hypothetical protein COA99_19565 [Moraxellaceae bacterium]